MKTKRLTYHHGDLRAALIQAADGIIAENGIEAFSLRAAAQRAGVSPAAPAHHFGSTRGLLTEVALLAFERVDNYIQKAGHSNDAVTDVRSVSLAFLKFVLDNPGHFRLMFRNDLVDREDPRFAAVSKRPGMRLSRAIFAYHGRPDPNPESFGDAADMLCGLSTLHGLAHLTLENKAAHWFQDANAENFVGEYLPKVIERLYPDRSQVGLNTYGTQFGGSHAINPTAALSTRLSKEGL